MNTIEQAREASKEAFIAAGWWPNNVMWNCWCQAWDAAQAQPVRQPLGYIGKHVADSLKQGCASTTTMTKHMAFEDDVALYLAAGAQPYDQQALELCETCGWKAVIPGEPCLVCERNAKMLAASEAAMKAVLQQALDALEWAESVIDTGRSCQEAKWSVDKAMASIKQALAQPAEPLSDAEVDACFNGPSTSGFGKSRYDIARAIEAKIKDQS